MIKILPLAKRHTGCPRCNYQGCVWAREKYGEFLGHAIWSLKLLQLNINKFIRTRIERLTALDYSQVEVLEIDNLTGEPDFCDAYIVAANYKGREMTEAELDKLNDDPYFVSEAVIKYIY